MSGTVQVPLASVTRYSSANNFDGYVTITEITTDKRIVVIGTCRSVPGSTGEAFGRWDALYHGDLPTKSKYHYILDRFGLLADVFTRSDLAIANALYKEAHKELERKLRDYQARDHSGDTG